MHRVTLKTSTIFIAKGGNTSVYHSVADIPHHLRQQMEDCTNGFNSATILIADRRGREEIRRALSGLPSGLRTRLASSLAPGSAAPAPASHSENPETPWRQSLPVLLRRHWFKVALPAAGLIVWAIAQFR